MNIDQFKAIDVAQREQKPKLFSLSTPAACANPEMLNEVEGLLGVVLPSKYREFLTAFGGGDFGLVNVFSADKKNEWYLCYKLEELHDTLPQGYLPFSDDNAGGYYVLKVQNGEVKDRVFYWNYEEQDLRETPFSDILEFVARYAYEPA